MFEYVADRKRTAWTHWSPVFGALSASAILAVLLHGFMSRAFIFRHAGTASAIEIVIPFVGAAGAGLFAFRVYRVCVPAGPWPVTLAFASVGIWASPLLLAVERGPLWSSAAGALFGIAITRLLREYDAEMTDRDESTRQPSGLLTGVIVAQPPAGRLLPFFAALSMQFGLLAGASGWSISAASLLGLACLSVTWANRQHAPRAEFRLSRRFMAGVLLNLVLGWAITSHLLTSHSAYRSGSHNEKIARSENGTDVEPNDAYSGIILLSELPQRNVLRTPPPHKAQMQTRPATATPADFPFSGEYWFLQRHMRRPPSSALRRAGSPLSYNFTNVDHSPLSMQARQILSAPIDVSCCSRIDVAITNNDVQQKFLGIELILITSEPPQPLGVSLGTIALDSLRLHAGKKQREQILRFDLPAQAVIRHFDEIRVVFHLEGPRMDRSANVSIDRFHLVPRGM